MRSTKTISNAIATLLCIFACTTFIAAQSPTPPTPPSTSKSKRKTTTTSTSTDSKSSQKVDINMNGNKLSLDMDDDVFDLDMVFDFDATDVIVAISEELGSPMKAGIFRAWKGTGYDIKSKMTTWMYSSCAKPFLALH